MAIGPSPDAMDDEQAAEILAGMPKPLTCMASTGAGGILSVTCEPIIGIDEAGLHASVVKGLDHHFGFGSADLVDYERTLLVRSPDERERISLAAFRRWYQDYLPPSSIALGFDLPSAAELADGDEVEKVLEVVHVDPVDRENIPPELRFLKL